MIACGLTVGISKTELFTAYYPDEISLIFQEYNRLHHPQDEVENMDMHTFFAEGGEMV